MSDGVTAIFAGCDVVAMASLKTLHEMGKKVPEDVALIGMDDLPLSEWITPALSTVRYDISKMAALAAKFVINKIQSPLIQKSMLHDVPGPQLVVRSTC